VSQKFPKVSRLRWCTRADVLDAFRVVGQEIRTKCRRYAETGITQAEACEVARRIRDQRELIRQLADRRNNKHARRLLRLNKRLRERLLTLIERAGLEKDVLIFK
jgi:hypothetical protein